MKFGPKDQSNNFLTAVQIMAWRRCQLLPSQATCQLLYNRHLFLIDCCCISVYSVYYQYIIGVSCFNGSKLYTHLGLFLGNWDERYKPEQTANDTLHLICYTFQKVGQFIDVCIYILYKAVSNGIECNSIEYMGVGLQN